MFTKIIVHVLKTTFKLSFALKKAAIAAGNFDYDIGYLLMMRFPNNLPFLDSLLISIMIVQVPFHNLVVCGSNDRTIFSNQDIHDQQRHI